MGDSLITNNTFRITPLLTRTESEFRQQNNANEGGDFLNLQDQYVGSFSNDSGTYNPRMFASFNKNNAALSTSNDNDKKKDAKEQKKEQQTSTEPVKDALWYVDKGGSAIEDGSSPLESRKATRETIDRFSKMDETPSILNSQKTVLSPGIKTATKYARFAKPIAGLGDATQLFTGGVEAYEVSQNNSLTANQKTVEYSKIGGKTVGAIGGGLLGSYIGATVGATVGAVGGPPGIVIGSVLGSVIGGYIGDEIGGAAGEYLGDKISTAIVGEDPKPQIKAENTDVKIIDGFNGPVKDTAVPVIRPTVDGQSKTSIEPAKQIRDNVMRQFGYSDEMIAAYDQKFPTDKTTRRPIRDGFYIGFNDEEKWASPDQVAKMKGDETNVIINVGAASVQHLKDFYESYERQNP